MNGDVVSNFTSKFSKLSADNQRYVMAIVQAFLFAQTSTRSTANESNMGVK